MRFTLSMCMACLALTVSAQTADSKSPGFGEGYDAVMLLDSVGVAVTDLGSGTFDIHNIIRVQNNRGALAHRVIKYDYDPLTAFAQFRSVTVRKADGTVREIDTAAAKDYAAPARSIYWGARQIMIEVGALEPGDVVDYRIAKSGFTYALLAADDDERFVPPMRGHFYDIVPFWVSYPTETKVYTVSVPRDKDLQYEFFQGECSSAVRRDGDRRIYSFTTHNTLPFKQEANMVNLFDVAPKLMMSSTEKWEDKSLWFYGVNEDYGSFEATPEAQKKVDELLRGKTDDMERIATLTHWVADNMRYSGISMGKGEGYTLHNTATNFTDRCGVCKDKAALLISMLRMAGYEAYPAMTMAGSRIEQIPADHFNHCVAVVKIPATGQYMPLDPTWVPFLRELWSSAEQQQNYLPGIPEGSPLMLTPTSDPMNHYVKLHAATSLDEKGTLTGEFTIEAEGQSDGAIRRPFTRSYESEWMNALETELLRVSPQAKVLKVDYGKNPKDYVSAPIKITMRFAIPGYAAAGEGVLMCKPLVFNNLYRGVMSYLRIDTSNPSRKYGFKDSCSRYVELEESMTLPAGYTMVQNGYSDEEKSIPVDYRGSMSSEGGKVKVSHALSLKKRVYEAEDWADFSRIVNKQKSAAGETLVFEKR